MWESRGIMLTAEELVRRRTKTDFALPQRGPKCFTPSGSWLESKQLRSLLDATKDLIAEERVERESALAQADWDENLKVAKVTRVVGRQFEKFGHEDNMTIFLHPEEALYLLETNHLQLIYGGVSMSIQQAYSLLLGPKTGCTFMEYMVFSHLLKNGFKVLRHSPKRTVTRYERLIGLHQQHPKSRKSRRKSSAPLRYSSCENNEKSRKTVKNVETENQKLSLESFSVNMQPMETDSKSGKPTICTSVAEDNVVDVHSSQSFESAVVCNFSSGSDIEILSEKSVSKTEDSLEYDITDYSSSSSEDSDCQVIFSEDEVCAERSKRKVIEEINLGDSSESETDRVNIENPSHIKSENVEEIIHDGALSIELKTLQDEPNFNSNNECSLSENHQAGSLNLEANEVSVEELKKSNDLAEQNHGCQKLLGVQSIEENEVTSSIEPDVSVQENSEEIVCVPIAVSMKQEKVKQESTPIFLPRVSVIQRNINVPLKKESDKIILEVSHKDKEIEVIDLDDDDDDEHDHDYNDDNNDTYNNVNNNTSNQNYIVEDKHTILLMFPNCAGCHTVRCEVPPQHLCPPNVNPTLQFYNIVLDRLQDPEYGGNPRKIKNNERFHNNYGRYQNSGYTQNNGPRFHSYPIKPFNRRCLNFSRENEGYDRYNQWHEGPVVCRDESFRDPRMFREHSLMGPYFQPMNTNQDQNEYAHFSGHLPNHLFPYQRSRPNLRRRGNYGPRQYRSNSHRHYPYHNSRGRSQPRRKSRASYPDRNVAARNEYNTREVRNEREEGYGSFNLDNSDNHSDDEHRRSSHDRKRRGRPIEENRNSGGSGRKQARGMRHTGRYFLPSSSSQDLLNFLDSIQENNEGNSVTNLAKDCNNSQEDFSVTRGRSSALADSENSESSESSESSTSESNHNSSGSSEESSSESMDENTGDGVGCTISALFKSDNVEDIDTSLKNLEIVHNVKFQEHTSLSVEQLLIIKFDLYQPYTPFRRSDPPIPDFRVVVMQPDQTLPTSRQLAFLEQGFDDDVPLLFAIASVDSVAFYLQSVVNLPPVCSKENVQG